MLRAGAARGLSTAAPRLRILESTSTNAAFNLATEEYIFEQMPSDSHVLFLWRNKPTVVLGKHQNAWSECNLSNMEEDDVHLVRRRSGGGAVYQDLGNTCWTFMSPMEDYSKERNTDIVVSALDRLGVRAQASGRNDILVDGRKVSGSAFKLASDRAFHHGTLLLDLDTSVMSRYLTPNKKKLESKAIQSVEARVMNLTEAVPGLDHARTIRELAAAFSDCYGVTDARLSEEPELLREEELGEMPAIAANYASLSDWHWRFGASPKFSHSLPQERFAWGSLDVRLDVRNGLVHEVAIFSDALDVTLVESAVEALQGARYDGDDLATRLRAVGSKGSGDARAQMEELADWVHSEVRGPAE